MEKLKNSFSLLCVLMCCQLVVSAQTWGQRTSTVIYPQNTIVIDYEKFDMKPFLRKFYASGSLDYVYTDSKGSQIRVTCQRRGMNIEVYETPPLPYVHRIFKEFYPNGNLKQKGVYLPQQFRVGKWLECDERGNCSVMDYDRGRGVWGYNDILKFVEEKGYINTKTGVDNYPMTFWFNEASREWGVKLAKDHTYYKRFTFKADSGEVLSEDEYKASVPPSTSDYYNQE